MLQITGIEISIKNLVFIGKDNTIDKVDNSKFVRAKSRKNF